MENKTKLYLLSFGDSEKYRVPFDGTADDLKKSSLIQTVKKEIEDYIKSKIGEGSEASIYAEPQIQEISPADEKEYEKYPLFDSSAIQKIKKVLLTEVQDMDSLKQMNSDAPFGLL